MMTTVKRPVATPYWQTTDEETVKLYLGDVTDVLRKLPSNSAHMVVTSPPYYGLRDYGTAEWEGGSEECDHKHENRGNVQYLDRNGKLGKNNTTWRGAERHSTVHLGDTCKKCGARRIDSQIGSESTPEEYISKLVSVFREVRRVLRNDGTVWLNLGDSYAAGGGGFGEQSADHIDYQRNTRRAPTPHGMKCGNLLGMPWRVALALQVDGWILRQDIIYYKSNCMPESITTRCTKSHEYLFLLAQSKDYYYDAEAIKEKAIPATRIVKEVGKCMSYGSNQGMRRNKQSGNAKPGSVISTGNTSNKRSVWNLEDHRSLLDWLSINHPELLQEYFSQSSNKRDVFKVAPAGYPGAHFACVDSETQALTRHGWRYNDALEDGDEIVAYDRKADKLIWQEASFHRYDYNGRLVIFNKRDTSQYLTPNHRCLIKSRKGFIKVKHADKLKQGDNFLMAAEMVEEPSFGIGIDMAELLGWWTSEGHHGNGRFPVCISQSESVNPDKVDKIRLLLRRMGAVFKTRRRLRDYKGETKVEIIFEIGGKVAWDLCNISPDKNISDRITKLPKEELEAILRSFTDGDGCRRVDGRSSIIQKDLKRIEQLQIIAIKLGYRAQLSTRRADGMYVLYITTGKWLNVRGTNGIWKGIQTEIYKGCVWCPNVESGFWLARRKGKPFITGNTFPHKLIEPCILAGTSEHGCCAECGKPWVREVVRTGVNGDDNEVVKSDKALRGIIGGKEDSRARRLSGQTYQHTRKALNTWRQNCNCDTEEVVPCVVLDPFIGSGTTTEACISLDRRCVGIDLSENYLRNNAIPRIIGSLISRPATAHLVPRSKDSNSPTIVGRTVPKHS